MKPLHHLTEHSVRFLWTEECELAFQELKHRLITAPILSYPDFSKEFVLDTDTSNFALGAVLSQVQNDGSERVIAYGSRLMTKTERRYCATRCELLSVVTFVKQFHPYLLGRHFKLRTDHGSLVWLKNFKEPAGQLARWLERLQQYDFTIIHRRGRKHCNADAMSRIPCSQCGRSEPSLNEEELSCISMVVGKASEVGEGTMRKLQLEDSEIGPLLLAMEAGVKPDLSTVQSYTIEGRRLFQLWDQLYVHKDILWRRFENKDGRESIAQLVVPRVARENILSEIHSSLTSAHLGEQKTLSRLKERFYWPGHYNDVTDWCKRCVVCSRRKSPVPRNQAALQPVKAGYPLQIVATDILGPLPKSKNGNVYVLVASDYFTRWAEAYAIPNQEAETVVKKLTNEMFCRFSIPEQLHSDQGRQFEPN